MHLMMIAAIFGSIRGFFDWGSGGASLTCFRTTASGLSPSNGSDPVKI